MVITRSQMMAGIKNKNTKPEILIRKHLFSRGYRYRLHISHLPGKPDILMPKYRAAIFINGCFWHGHACHLFKWPKSSPEFWKEKILSNKARDAKNYLKLKEAGWRVLVIHECALRGKIPESQIHSIMDRIVSWILTGNGWMELSGATS